VLKFEPLRSGMDSNYVLGGLEPHFRVLFSTIFQGVPWEFPSTWKKVECSGSKIAANCCKSTYIILVRFNHVCGLSPAAETWWIEV